MSGGHFNDSGYVYYAVHQFADELESDIENNAELNDGEWHPNFSKEVLEVLEEELPLIKQAARVMQLIDYLYSGDYGEETFLEKYQRSRINGVD